MGLEAQRQAHSLSLLYSAQAVGKGYEVPSASCLFQVSKPYFRVPMWPL